MTAPRWAKKGVLLPATAIAVLGLSAAACSSSGSSTTSPPDDALSPTPLATSLESAGATWATIPMGNLDQPLNTFWQLFELPQGATRWSNQVQSTEDPAQFPVDLMVGLSQPTVINSWRISL